MKITKIDHDGWDTRIEWTEESANDKDDERMLRSRDFPAPAFIAALEALVPDVMELCELPAAWAEELRVCSVRRGQSGVTIEAMRPLTRLHSSMQVKTPCLPITSPTKVTLPPMTAHRVMVLCQEAIAYVQGDRAQAELDFDGGEDAEEDEDAPISIAHLLKAASVTEKMLECREAVRVLWGEQYDLKMVTMKAAVLHTVLTNRDLSPIEAVVEGLKERKEDQDGSAILLWVAALVEYLEEDGETPELEPADETLSIGTEEADAVQQSVDAAQDGTPKPVDETPEADAEVVQAGESPDARAYRDEKDRVMRVHYNYRLMNAGKPCYSTFYALPGGELKHYHPLNAWAYQETRADAQNELDAYAEEHGLPACCIECGCTEDDGPAWAEESLCQACAGRQDADLGAGPPSLSDEVPPIAYRNGDGNVLSVNSKSGLGWGIYIQGPDGLAKSLTEWPGKAGTSHYLATREEAQRILNDYAWEQGYPVHEAGADDLQAAV